MKLTLPDAIALFRAATGSKESLTRVDRFEVHDEILAVLEAPTIKAAVECIDWWVTDLEPKTVVTSIRRLYKQMQLHESKRPHKVHAHGPLLSCGDIDGDKFTVAALRHRRIRSGLSQVKLGDKVGLSGSAIGAYERGSSGPDVPMLNALSRALDCDATELIGEMSVQFLPEVYTTRPVTRKPRP